jgi:hypothetical protein
VRERERERERERGENVMGRRRDDFGGHLKAVTYMRHVPACFLVLT